MYLIARLHFNARRCHSLLRAQIVGRIASWRDADPGKRLINNCKKVLLRTICSIAMSTDQPNIQYVLFAF